MLSNISGMARPDWLGDARRLYWSGPVGWHRYYPAFPKWRVVWGEDRLYPSA